MLGLMFYIAVALILGLPGGAIGGWILGKVWKNDKAAIIGGIISGMILSAGIFLYNWYGQ
jgi:hypothetical protein